MDHYVHVPLYSSCLDIFRGVGLLADNQVPDSLRLFSQQADDALDRGAGNEKAVAPAIVGAVKVNPCVPLAGNGSVVTGRLEYFGDGQCVRRETVLRIDFPTHDAPGPTP